MVPLGSLLLLISSYILLLISAKSCSFPRLALRVCSASPSSALRRLVTGPPYTRVVGRGRRPPRASSQRSLDGRCRLLRLPSPRVCPAQRDRRLPHGWSEYATRRSSAADSRIGTVAHLTKLLEELIKEDTARKHFPRDSVSGLPTEAAPPQLAAGGSTQLAAKAEGRRSLALSTPTRWRCGLQRDSTRTS